ncbi:uncharacterized protein LOC144909720 [Branchiostoma floridae x Branchiostoma belcheri]
MENATETHRSSDGGKINPCPERSWRSARDRLSPYPNRPARSISNGLKPRPDRPAAGRPIGNGLNPCPDRLARPVGDRLNPCPNRSSRPVGDKLNPCPDRPGLPERSRPESCQDGSQRPGGDRRAAYPDTTADTPLGPRPSAPANSSEDWPSITPYCVAYLRLPPMAQDQNATVVDGTFRVHMYHTLPDEEEVEADDAGNRLPEDPLPGDSYHDNDDEEEEEEEKGASLQGWLQEILSGHYNNPESPEQEDCSIDPPCIDSRPNGEIGAACSALSSPDAASCTDMARPQPQSPADYPTTTRTRSPCTSGDPGTCTETTHLGHSENKSSDTTRPKPLRLQVDHAAKATVPRMPVVTTRTKSPGTRGDQGTENTRLGHSENNSSDTTRPKPLRLQVDYAAKATVPRVPVVTTRTKSPGTRPDPGTENTRLGHSETNHPKSLRLQVDYAAKATVPRIPAVTTRTKSPGTRPDPGTETTGTHLGHADNNSSKTNHPKSLRLQVDYAAKATVPRVPVVTTRTKSPGTRPDQGTENTRLGHSDNNSSKATHPRSSRLQVDYAAKATVPRIPLVTKRGAKGMIKQQSNLGHLRVSRDDDSRQHSTSTSASDVTIAMETSGESADSDDTQTTGGDTRAHYENVTEKTAQNCFSGWKSPKLKTSNLLLVLAAVAVIVGLVVILTYPNGPTPFWTKQSERPHSEVLHSILTQPGPSTPTVVTSIPTVVTSTPIFPTSTPTLPTTTPTLATSTPTHPTLPTTSEQPTRPVSTQSRPAAAGSVRKNPPVRRPWFISSCRKHKSATSDTSSLSPSLRARLKKWQASFVARNRPLKSDGSFAYVRPQRWGPGPAYLAAAREQPELGP